ncbi:MAG: transporter substrate-binding domain-containing protein [Pseudomonas sp.]|uniref:substrate-binding periplasmic protein n=1 Tax=Pseudomonas sp. TaxID=306 RepID=UPI003397324F
MKTTLSFWFVLLTAYGASSTAEPIKGVTEVTSYTYLRNDRVAGPATAVVQATLQRAGLNDYSLALYPWARAYDMAQQEPNVLIFLIARTPAREPLFKWIGELDRIDYHFYKRRENTAVQVHDLEDAKRYSVGVLRDDVRHEYLKAKGFAKLVVSAQNADNFRNLLNQQVDLVPMPERDALLLCAEARVDCAQLEKVYTLDALATGLYMAYSPSTDDETVARTRAAFDKLMAEGEVKRLMDNAR